MFRANTTLPSIIMHILPPLRVLKITGVVLLPWLAYSGETILQSDIQPTKPGDRNYPHRGTG